MSIYAIAFDLDTDILSKLYPNDSHQNAYGEIKKFLENEGFSRKQGSVYFGDKEKVNAVSCIIAVQKLAKKHTWFKASVKDIQMLRIEENSDLAPTLVDL